MFWSTRFYMGTMPPPSFTRIRVSPYITPSNIILSRTNIRDMIRSLLPRVLESALWVRGYGTSGQSLQ